MGTEICVVCRSGNLLALFITLSRCLATQLGKQDLKKDIDSICSVFFTKQFPSICCLGQRFSPWISKEFGKKYSNYFYNYFPLENKKHKDLLVFTMWFNTGGLTLPICRTVSHVF